MLALNEGELHTVATLYPSRDPLLCPLNRGPDGPQSQFEFFGEEKNLLPLLGNGPHFFRCPALKMLSQLLYARNFFKNVFDFMGNIQAHVQL
jgi:hypothetical protein